MDNARRMTGRHETSKADEFTWGVENRSVTVRIPIDVAVARKVIGC